MEKSEQTDLEELWPLLYKDRSELTDEDIEKLLVVRKQLRAQVRHIWLTFPSLWHGESRRRKQKRELSLLSTEELQARIQSSGFEDKQIICQILRERLPGSIPEI